MVTLARRLSIGFTAAAIVIATAGVPFTVEAAQDRATGDQPAVPGSAPRQPQSAPAASACYERYIPAPVDEKGIQCPGEPAIWKSYTYASDGFGYYSEIDNFGGTPYVVRLVYAHRDGRVAISIMTCDASGCDVTSWNGIPFPYDETGQS